MNVPVADGQTVPEAPLPAQHLDTGVSAASQGVGIGEGLAAAAGAVGDAAARERQRNELRAERARQQGQSLALDTANTDLMVFGNTLLGNLLEQSGPTLSKGVEHAYEALDTETARLAAALPDEETRALFSNPARRQRLQFQGSLERHVSADHAKTEEIELKRSQAAIRARGITMAPRSVTLLPDGTVDATALRMLRTDMRTQVFGWAQRNASSLGPDPVGIAAETEAEMWAQLQAEVVRELQTQGKDREAAAYFKQFQAEFSPDQRAQIAKTVQAGQLAGDIVRVSEDTFERRYLAGPDEETEAVRFLNTLQEFRDATKDAPELQEQGVARLHRRREEVLGLIEDDRREKFHGVQKSIQDGRPTDLVLSDPRLGELEPTEVKTIQEMLDLRNKEGATESSGKVLFTLRDMLANPTTRPRFAKLDLNLFVTALSDTDWRFLKERQDDLNSGSPKLLQSFVDDETLLNGAAESIFGLIDKDSDADTRAQVYEFKTAMQERLSKATEGKATTFEEKRNHLRRWTGETVFLRSGDFDRGGEWGKHVSYFEATEALKALQRGDEDAIEDFDVNNIPPDQLRELRSDLVLEGLEPDSEAVVRRYLEVIARGGDL